MTEAKEPKGRAAKVWTERGLQALTVAKRTDLTDPATKGLVASRHAIGRQNVVIPLSQEVGRKAGQGDYWGIWKRSRRNWSGCCKGEGGNIAR